MAANDTLSDKTIRAALKAAVLAGKPRKISDGGGLVLEARPTGAGWWRLRYWRDSKEGMLRLGTYPDVSLKDARQRRDDTRKLVATGVDPSAPESLKALQVKRLRGFFVGCARRSWYAWTSGTRDRRTRAIAATGRITAAPTVRNPRRWSAPGTAAGIPDGSAGCGRSSFRGCRSAGPSPWMNRPWWPGRAAACIFRSCR